MKKLVIVFLWIFVFSFLVACDDITTNSSPITEVTSNSEEVVDQEMPTDPTHFDDLKDEDKTQTPIEDGDPAIPVTPHVPITPTEPKEDETQDDPPDVITPSDPSEEIHNHILDHADGKSATCTEDGNIEYWHCAECGLNFIDSDAENKIVGTVIISTGHNYTITVIAPTCTVDGYTLHKCKACNDEYTTDIKPATGHKYGETITVSQPTCTQSGLERKICEACGKTEESELPPLGHDYEPTVIAPTCTVGGYTLHKCKNCSDEYTTDIKSATGHKYSEAWSYDGEKHWHESSCGCGITTEKVAHEHNVDGVCECGHEEWDYKLIYESNGSECIVSGIRVNEGIAESSLEIVIPDVYNGSTVTKIGDNAFRDNVYMKSVYIPKSIKAIGKGAFADCSITSAEFETRSGWKYSKYEDGRNPQTLSLATGSKLAKQLKSKSSPSGYAAYYWFN